jgi:cytochrome c biogenesis protein CcdA
MTIALVYAMSLGLVAAVNPCGFPLLPAYLAYFASSDSGTSVQRVARGLRAGLAVTLGFVLVFGVAGLLVEVGLPLVLAWVPWVMVLVGLGMAVLGLIAVIRGYFSLRLPSVPLRADRTLVATVGFGVTYAVASMSCSLPLFLAGVAGAFTRESVVAGVTDFLAYAVGMGVFVVVGSVITAIGGTSALRRLRPVARFAPRIAGSIIIVVGLYVAYYWIMDLVDPLSTPPITAAVNAVQSSIANWISAAAVPILACLIVGTLVAVAILLVARRGAASRAATVTEAEQPHNA